MVTNDWLCCAEKGKEYSRGEESCCTCWESAFVPCAQMERGRRKLFDTATYVKKYLCIYLHFLRIRLAHFLTEGYIKRATPMELQLSLA